MESPKPLSVSTTAATTAEAVSSAADSDDAANEQATFGSNTSLSGNQASSSLLEKDSSGVDDRIASFDRAAPHDRTTATTTDEDSSIAFYKRSLMGGGNGGSHDIGLDAMGATAGRHHATTTQLAQRRTSRTNTTAESTAVDSFESDARNLLHNSSPASALAGSAASPFNPEVHSTAFYKRAMEGAATCTTAAASVEAAMRVVDNIQPPLLPPSSHITNSSDVSRRGGDSSSFGSTPSPATSMVESLMDNANTAFYKGAFHGSDTATATDCEKTRTSTLQCAATNHLKPTQTAIGNNNANGSGVALGDHRQGTVEQGVLSAQLTARRGILPLVPAVLPIALVDAAGTIAPSVAASSLHALVPEGDNAVAADDVVYDGEGRPVLQCRRETQSLTLRERQGRVAASSHRQGRRRHCILCAIMSLVAATVVASSAAIACVSQGCLKTEPTQTATAPTIRTNAISSPTLVSPPGGASPDLERRVRAFLSNITLSDQVFVEATTIANDNGTMTTTPEELAIERLLDMNYLDQWPPPDSLSHQFQWTQRYALACLFATANKASHGPFWNNRTLRHPTMNECEWDGVTCQEVDLGPSIGIQNVSTKLDVIDFALMGRLPADVGLLSWLEYVDVSFNDLTGPLPLSMGRWTKLQFFSAAVNELSGSLPDTLRGWTDVRHFDLGPNRMTGSLPSWVGQWTQLQYFSAALNDMTGTLPHDIGRWTDLRDFNIYGNQWFTSLPNSIGAWTNLDFLDAAWNRLTGSLPSSIGHWTNATVVSFTSNRLAGSIPSSIGGWASMERAYLGSNNFTGSVPDSVCTSLPIGASLVVDADISCRCCQ